MRKRFFVRTESEQVRYLDGFVQLDCEVGQAIRLVLARQHAVSETPGAGPRFVGISLSGQRFDLPSQIPSPDFDIRGASLPASTFDSVADNATIGLLGTDLARHDEPAGRVTLNMHGFSMAYAKLRKSCDEPARNAIAVTLPGNKPVPFLDPGVLRTLSLPAVDRGRAGPQNRPAAP
jgi:hypothetical protein